MWQKNVKYDVRKVRIYLFTIFVFHDLLLIIFHTYSIPFVYYFSTFFYSFLLFLSFFLFVYLFLSLHFCFGTVEFCR